MIVASGEINLENKPDVINFESLNVGAFHFFSVVYLMFASSATLR